MTVLIIRSTAGASGSGGGGGTSKNKSSYYIWNYNSMFLILTSLLLLITITKKVNCSKADSYGLGDHINWVGLEDGYEQAMNTQRPLMLIIHKSWCGACKALKPRFKESNAIHELSKSFIMVNVQDDDEPEGDIYQPDGGYIPRILFFDHEGKLLRNIINEDGNPKYQYYYSSDEPIVQSMKKVLQIYSETDEHDEEENTSSKKSNSSKVEL